VRRKMKRKWISYAPMIDMEMKRNDYLSTPSVPRYKA
jgi:hypothetical protein